MQQAEAGKVDEEDEDGSRMDLLADLREEQRARKKGGGRSASALMGARQGKEKAALVIKGQGEWGRVSYITRVAAAFCWMDYVPCFSCYIPIAATVTMTSLGALSLFCLAA